MSTLFKMLLLVYDAILSFLFPPSEDELTIKGITCDQIARHLNVRTHNGVTVLTSFDDPVIRSLLHLVKYHDHPQALVLAAYLFETWLTAHQPEPALIIPIPLSLRRLRERGYNQTERVARRAVKRLSKHTVDTSILKRTRHTVPQTSLDRQERQHNLKGAFALSRSVPLPDQTIIIFDDVTTTGATLEAARLALLPLSPKRIVCVAIAH